VDEKRKVVLGLGNLLQRDEGFGIHALDALENSLNPLPEDIEFVDGGVLGLNLLPLVEDCSHLLVLDAVNSGRPPGTIIELRDHEIPLYNNVKLSEHQVSFQEVLGLAMLRGGLPEHLHLLGIQPADLSSGIDLSPVVEKTLAAVTQRSGEILRNW
jgi:hydrogenase maturation protease